MAGEHRIERVAVLGGGGLMGHGIALACLVGSRCEVRLVSPRRETVERGLELVTTGPFGLERAVQRGRLDAAQAASARGRLSATTDYAEGLDGVELVFESVPEVAEVKLAALAEVERAAPEDVLVATNTSAIMISELAGGLRRPERLIGAHWFYPANVMPLVEMVRGRLSAASTVDAVSTYLQTLGKRPVVVGDGPGFFMTRFVNVFLSEAIRLVELDIAGPAEIDEMVRMGLGWPMGPFELLDDTACFESFCHSLAYLAETCGERYAVPPLARQVRAAGYLGDPKLKPGSKGGWYEFLGATRPPKRAG
ncbi:MAG: 3-hydroxyacyl-CoA dehydrogenase family protein [Acidimicrobiia bacterium]